MRYLYHKCIFRVVAGSAEGKSQMEYLTSACTWTPKRELAVQFDMLRQQERDAAGRMMEKVGGGQLED